MPDWWYFLNKKYISAYGQLEKVDFNSSKYTAEYFYKQKIEWSEEYSFC